MLRFLYRNLKSIPGKFHVSETNYAARFETSHNYSLESYVANMYVPRPRQNGHHFEDDTFKWIFLHENRGILVQISLKMFPMAQQTISNYFNQCWYNLLTRVYATRPQWINTLRSWQHGRHFPEELTVSVSVNRVIIDLFHNNFSPSG